MSNDIALWRRGDAYPANWPQWLREADIEWARVEVKDGSGVVVWHDGVWHDGRWHDGEWFDGRWYGGSWHAGVWYGGHWHDGVQWRTDGPPAAGDLEART